jgi:hypothetical protein
VIQLADSLDGALQFLVIAQPLTHLGDLFAMQAELPGAAAGIADGENCLRVALTTGALGATAGMTRSALDERAAQDFAGGGEAFEEALTSLDGLLVCHLYR